MFSRQAGTTASLGSNPLGVSRAQPGAHTRYAGSQHEVFTGLLGDQEEDDGGS